MIRVLRPRQLNIPVGRTSSSENPDPTPAVLPHCGGSAFEGPAITLSLKASWKSRSVHGSIAPGFEPVADAFAANFEEEGEVGAALCVYHHGHPVVDLWGGLADAAQKVPWRADTRVPLFSTGKGAIAAACAVAASRGLFAFDDRVAQHWPSFAQCGKEDITIRQILDHSAGLILFGRQVTSEMLADPEGMAEVMASMEPAWSPGEACGYHLATFGTLLSHLISRVDPQGRFIASYFAEEIASPLDLDIKFGLEYTEDCAALSLPGLRQFSELMRSAPFSLQVELYNPFSLLHRSIREIAPRFEDRSWIRHDMPSGNAVGSARSVAKLYMTLAEAGGVLGLTPDVYSALLAPSRVPSNGCRDRLVGVETAWSLGFLRPTKHFRFSPTPECFGMPGLGGSFGFADPILGIGYGYTPNRLGLMPFNDRRDARLREALYASI